MQINKLNLSIPIALLLAAAFPSTSPADDAGKLSPKKLSQRLVGFQGQVHYGGFMIDAGETLAGPILVIEGSLDIQDGGILDGSAWIVNGDLILTGSARVTGTVHLVNGEEYASRSARVEGGISRYTCNCQLDAETYEERKALFFIKRDNPMSLNPRLAIGAGRPTRVRYDLLQVGVQRDNPRRPDPYTRFHAMLILPLYADTQHGWLDFTLDVSVPLRGRALELELMGYKALQTQDEWQVSRNENALFLVVAASEFANYYQKRGGSLALRWRPDPYLEFKLGALYEQELSMSKGRIFSLFGNADDLSGNHPIEEGRRAAGFAGFIYDSREDSDYPTDAWNLMLALQRGRLNPDEPAGLPGGDTAAAGASRSYTAFALAASRYTQFGWLQWDLGSRLVSAFDRIPLQLYQTLDGYGGVRGAASQPFSRARGDRLIWLSTELRVRLPDLPFVDRLFSRWDLLLFGDAGYLTEAENPQDPFRWLEGSWSDWIKSVGLGVTGESLLPYVGVYVAKQIDGAERDPRFIFRLKRSF